MIEIRKASTKSNDFKNIKRVYNTVFPQNELLPLSLLKMRAKAGKAEFCSIYNEKSGLAFSIQFTINEWPIFSSWQLIRGIIVKALGVQS